MYRTLADSKLLRRLPHGRVILYDIISNLHGSLFNIIFQKNPPANVVFTMYAGGRKVMPLNRIPLCLLRRYSPWRQAIPATHISCQSIDCPTNTSTILQYFNSIQRILVDILSQFIKYMSSLLNFFQ